MSIEHGKIEIPGTRPEADYVSMKEKLGRPITDGEIIVNSLRSLVYRNERRYTTGFAPPDLPPPEAVERHQKTRE